MSDGESLIERLVSLYHAAIEAPANDQEARWLDFDREIQAVLNEKRTLSDRQLRVFIKAEYDRRRRAEDRRHGRPPTP